MVNPYELADELDKYKGIATRNAANMLRQQADKIAELEKQSEPVAWMSPDGKVSQTEGKLFYIPLYTTPQTKPLSDAIEIVKEFQGDYELTFKAYEDTYADGWTDACNEILWAIEAKVRGQ